LITVFVKLLDTTDPTKKAFNIDCSNSPLQKNCITQVSLCHVKPVLKINSP